MPCDARVKVTYDKDGKVTNMELLCGDVKCDDGTACKPNPATNDKKGSDNRQYCACKDGKGDEPTECHIVLYTVRNKAGKVTDRYYKCEPEDKPDKKVCPANQVCAPLPVANNFFEDDPEKLEWVEIKCQCQSKDDVYPEM